MTFGIWLVFILSAILEIGGDALIRKGLHASGLLFIVAGFIVLGCYGLVVNLVKWDFSKLLGVYIAFFAVLSVLFSRYIFRETIPGPTWLGISIITVGGMIIQFGSSV